MSTILRLDSGAIMKYDTNMCRPVVRFLIVAAFSVWPLVCSAQLQIPANDGYFTSVVSVISSEESEKFEAALADMAQSLNQYVVVLFMDDLFHRDIAQVAESVQKEWNLPKNSILLLVSYTDRQAFILPGDAVSQISESASRGIVEKDIVPRMRAGEYNLAIIDGTEAILRHLSGLYSDDRYAESAGLPTSLFVVILYSIVVLVALSWLLGTIVLFTTNYPYSIAGTLLGPIIGVLLLEKYGLWLSIPPFVIAGFLSDVGVHKFYKAVLPHPRTAKRRHRR